MPASFTVTRSIDIRAPAERLYPHIADFHAWAAWSPYEKKDLAMKKTEETQEALKQAVGNEDPAGMDARGWVIYGGICDQYGFPDAAATAWEKARAAKTVNSYCAIGSEISVGLTGGCQRRAANVGPGT